MKATSLKQISVPISPEIEDAIAVLLEKILGVFPSIYVDAETGRMTATVYVEPAVLKPALLEKLKAELSELQPDGMAGKKIKVTNLRREDWAESWKRHFKPIEIGDALLVKPSWSRRRLKKNQQVIILDPGLSFGTGQHATTFFCLRQIVNCRRTGEKQSFLDIGTGSGILAIAAAKLGYQPVEAFDYDGDAARIARENAATNKISARIVQRDLTKLPLRSEKRFDLVCANLTYDLLIEQAGRILNRLQTDGNLVLAGILKSQFALVKRVYEKRGLKLVASKIEREWQSGRFIFKKQLGQ